MLSERTYLYGAIVIISFFCIVYAPQNEREAEEVYKLFEELFENIDSIGKVQNKNNELERIFAIYAKKLKPLFQPCPLKPTLYGRLFHKVAGCCNGMILELFLNAGFDVNAANLQGKTPAICAAFTGNKSTLKIIIDHNADLTKKDTEGYTAEYWADFLPNQPDEFKCVGSLKITDKTLSWLIKVGIYRERSAFETCKKMIQEKLAELKQQKDTKT